MPHVLLYLLDRLKSPDYFYEWLKDGGDLYLNDLNACCKADKNLLRRLKNELYLKKLTYCNDTVVEKEKNTINKEIEVSGIFNKDITSIKFCDYYYERNLNNRKILIAGYKDGTITLWIVKTNKKLCTLHGHKSKIISIALSPDGKEFISLSKDGEINIWNIAFSIKHRIFKKKYKISFMATSLAYYPDGKKIIIGYNNGKRSLFDIENGKKIHANYNHKYKITSIAVHPNQETFFFGDITGNITLVNVKTFEKITTFQGHNNKIISIDFSPDGKEFMSTDSKGEMVTWNLFDENIENASIDCLLLLQAIMYNKKSNENYMNRNDFLELFKEIYKSLNPNEKELVNIFLDRLDDS